MSKITKNGAFFDDWLVDHHVKEPEKERIKIGFTELDQEVEFGVKQMGHTLISGMSRSGKTRMTSNILKSIIKFASVAVYTPKHNDYFMFRDKVGIFDERQMGKIIRRSIGEMERRNLRVLQESEETGEQQQCKEDPIILVIDEFTTFKESCDDGTYRAFQRLMSEGAGLNIFVYIITQVPNKRILDGIIREQIMTDIAFKQRDAYASRMAVGSRDAEFLELGQCIVRNVAQTFLVTRM